jgi:hypothetical protein
MIYRKIRILFITICILQLIHIFYFRSGFKYEVIKSPFNINSGVTFVVSSRIIEINDILKKQKVNDFNLSKIILDNNYINKKSVEFNYPIRLNKKSKNIFFTKEENIPNSCKIINTGKYFKFTEC